MRQRHLNENVVDYDALDRLFPRRWWFARVGRTWRQRAGYTKPTQDRGPRGRRGTTEADAISGEIGGVVFGLGDCEAAVRAEAQLGLGRLEASRRAAQIRVMPDACGRRARRRARR